MAKKSARKPNPEDYPAYELFKNGESIGTFRYVADAGGDSLQDYWEVTLPGQQPEIGKSRLHCARYVLEPFLGCW